MKHPFNRRLALCWLLATAPVLGLASTDWPSKPLWDSCPPAWAMHMPRPGPRGLCA